MYSVDTFKGMKGNLRRSCQVSEAFQLKLKWNIDDHQLK